jgi:hypothetical protein
MELTQTKNLLQAKETIHRVKRQLTEWKKIANYFSNKGVMFTMYEELNNTIRRNKIFWFKNGQQYE